MNTIIDIKDRFILFIGNDATLASSLTKAAGALLAAALISSVG